MKILDVWGYCVQYEQKKNSILDFTSGERNKDEFYLWEKLNLAS